MKKISGQLVSSKPVSLSRAAKLISRFAAVDNGSSPAVSIYLQRAAEAFNHLVQFHDHNQPLKQISIEKTPNQKNPDGESDEVSRKRRKRDEETVDERNRNPSEDEPKGVKKKKKDKKRKKSVEAVES